MKQRHRETKRRSDKDKGDKESTVRNERKTDEQTDKDTMRQTKKQTEK